MNNLNWGQVAVRLIDYCQTRDAFLRNTEITQDLVNIWADELSTTNQPEAQLRDAAARAYRNAGGKPPADPLGAIIAEAKLIARNNASVNWRDAILPPEGKASNGPVERAYAVDNAINLSCADHPASNGTGKHPGCGAAPGEYCVGRDGQPARIPHTARLLHARDHLTDEQRARRDAESPTMRGGPNP